MIKRIQNDGWAVIKELTVVDMFFGQGSYNQAKLKAESITDGHVMIARLMCGTDGEPYKKQRSRSALWDVFNMAVEQGRSLAEEQGITTQIMSPATRSRLIQEYIDTSTHEAQARTIPSMGALPDADAFEF